MKLLLSMNLMLFSFIPLFAQGYEDDRISWNKSRPAGYLTIRNDLNHQDYILGTELGMVNARRNLAAFITFDARPYRKRILQYQGNNMFFQFREERYFIGAGAEYMRKIKELPLAAFIQLNGLYTWGQYAGTDRKPDQGWEIVPRIGVALDLQSYGWLKVGYTYLDARSYRLDKHRLYIAITGFLSKGR